MNVFYDCWALLSFRVTIVFERHHLSTRYTICNKTQWFFLEKKTNLYTQWCNTPLFCVAKLPLIVYNIWKHLWVYAKDDINIRWYEYFNSTTKFDQSRNRDMRPVSCFFLWHKKDKKIYSKSVKYFKFVQLHYIQSFVDEIFPWTWYYFKNKFWQIVSFSRKKRQHNKSTQQL